MAADPAARLTLPAPASAAAFASGAVASQPIRVLHLRDSPWVDGPGRTIVESAAHVDPARVTYHIGAFVSDRIKGPHPLVEAARRRGLLVHEILDQGGVSAGVIERIIELIDQYGIQILHTHEFKSDLIGLLVRRRRPVILMTTAHGWIANDLRGRVFRFLNKVLLRQFDMTILVSHAMRDALPRFWVSTRRTRVLHNALVLESYGRDALTTPRRAFNPARINLLNVGRLSPEKGQMLLIDAVARLAARWPGLHLRFAGVGPLEAELRARATAAGIADRVEFLGYVHDMPALYAQTDLTVQSSFTEGLPNVILEAAFLRVPILATNVGGTGEVVSHGDSGWLIEPRSLRALEGGIEEFLRCPGKFAAMGEQAHRRIVDEFSFKVRTKRLTDIYESLLAERQ